MSLLQYILHKQNKAKQCKCSENGIPILSLYYCMYKAIAVLSAGAAFEAAEMVKPVSMAKLPSPYNLDLIPVTFK